ncbi:MAG: dihydrofolate reductase [Pseudomonadota bacterium]
MIAAVADNGIIGADNALPWHLPEDLQHFKRKTLGKCILMGRKTYESIGKALPARTNIVMTRDPDWQAEDATTVRSLKAAIALCKNEPELVIIGGAKVYEQSLAMTGTLYLTQIHKAFVGDTSFPVLRTGDWQEVSREFHPRTQSRDFGYSFVQLERSN